MANNTDNIFIAQLGSAISIEKDGKIIKYIVDSVFDGRIITLQPHDTKESGIKIINETN